jgi:hypothetical protein
MPWASLTRHGYNVKALSELLNLRQVEIKAFLQGQLPPGRAEELKQQILKEGIPRCLQAVVSHDALAKRGA